MNEQEAQTAQKTRQEAISREEQASPAVSKQGSKNEQKQAD